MSLTQEQVAHFLAEGYLELPPPDGEDALHREIFDAAEALGDTAEALGNNILPALPDLAAKIYETPRVQGALTSILGPGYAMHPHRFCHKSVPGRQAQTWHRDSFWGHWLPRNHRPYWVMALYFPQDTPVELGPTGIIPRSQYWNADAGGGPKGGSYRNLFGCARFADKAVANGTIGKRWHGVEKPLACRAGTVVLIHYDIWHRGPANLTQNGVRYMFKFQFMRMSSPTEAPLALGQPDWARFTTDADKEDRIVLARKLESRTVPRGRGVFSRAYQQPVWQASWEWLHGGKVDAVPLADAEDGAVAEGAAVAKGGAPVRVDIPRLFATLATAGDDAEPERVAAAYTLGALCRSGTLNPFRLVEKAGLTGRAAGQAIEAAGPVVLEAATSNQWLLAKDTAAFAVFSLGRVLDELPTAELGTPAAVEATRVLQSLCNPVAQGKAAAAGGDPNIVRTVAAFALGNVRTAEVGRALLEMAAAQGEGPDFRAAVWHSLLRLLTAGVFDEKTLPELGALAAKVAGERTAGGKYVSAYAAEAVHRVACRQAAEDAGPSLEFPPLIRFCSYGDGWQAR